MGIRCVDAFLLGNLLPDVYVGYMVPNITHKIPYRDTHFADPSVVPEPDYGQFFDNYCARDASGIVDDLVLGAWAHLVADHDYNKRVNAFFAKENITPSSTIREKKQSDFAAFGRTLDISLVPHITPEVLAQCARFPQYDLDPSDMHATEEAMAHIVEDNTEHHIAGIPDYQLLHPDFFSSTFDEVTEHIRTGLLAYTAGKADWVSQVQAGSPQLQAPSQGSEGKLKPLFSCTAFTVAESTSGSFSSSLAMLCSSESV